MRLGVAGWPVAHSRSPAIQNAALHAAGLGGLAGPGGWRYQLLPLPPAVFAETVAALPACGFRGINVTIPHKERALAFALDAGGEVSARARAIGAVNTLVFEAGGRSPAVRADNTDAPAFASALVAALGGPIAGLTALVLGAGGSARAAVWTLLDAGAAEVRVWNRNPARARALCEAVGGGRAAVALTAEPADVLVNCTSVGLHDGGPGELAQLPLAAGELAYRVVVDFVYRRGAPTALVQAARRQGLPTIDGLELLIGQGALSFEQFTGVGASVAAMRRAAGLTA